MLPRLCLNLHLVLGQLHLEGRQSRTNQTPLHQPHPAQSLRAPHAHEIDTSAAQENALHVSKEIGQLDQRQDHIQQHLHYQLLHLPVEMPLISAHLHQVLSCHLG